MAEIGTSPVNRLSGLDELTEALKIRTASGRASGPEFADVLSDAMEQYRQVDNEGDYATLNLLSGNTDDLASALIATEKAEIALNLTVAVRNKAVEAYKEIMNMQV